MSKLTDRCTTIAGWYYDQSTEQSVIGELEWCYQRLCELGDDDTINFINDLYEEHFEQEEDTMSDEDTQLEHWSKERL